MVCFCVSICSPKAWICSSWSCSWLNNCSLSCSDSAQDDLTYISWDSVNLNLSLRSSFYSCKSSNLAWFLFISCILWLCCFSYDSISFSNLNICLSLLSTYYYCSCILAWLSLFICYKFAISSVNYNCALLKSD